MDQDEVAAVMERMRQREIKRKQLAAQVEAARFMQRYIRGWKARKGFRMLRRQQQFLHDMVSSLVSGHYKGGGCAWAAVLDRVTGKILAQSPEIVFLAVKPIPGTPCYQDFCPEIFQSEGKVEEDTLTSVWNAAPKVPATPTSVASRPSSSASRVSRGAASRRTRRWRVAPPGTVLSSVHSLIRLAEAEPEDKPALLPRGGWKLMVRGKLEHFQPLRFSPARGSRLFRIKDPKQVRMGSISHAAVAAQATEKYVLLAGSDRVGGGKLDTCCMEVRSRGAAKTRGHASRPYLRQVAWMCNNLKRLGKG